MADKVKDDLVVTLDYTLIVEDEIMESTDDGEAIEFIQGIGQIIPGLEDALYGMEVGEKKTVVIEPEDAYGIYDEDSLEVARKDEFSEEIPLGHVSFELVYESKIEDWLGEPLVSQDWGKSR